MRALTGPVECIGSQVANACPTEWNLALIAVQHGERTQLPESSRMQRITSVHRLGEQPGLFSGEKAESKAESEKKRLETGQTYRPI